MGNSISSVEDDYDDYDRLCDKHGHKAYPMFSFNLWRKHHDELEQINKKPKEPEVPKKHISALAKPSVGDTVKDKLTGIEGVVVNKTFHIHGCEYLEVEPASDGNKISETIYKPIDRFEILKEGNYGVSEDVSGSHIKLGDEVEDLVTGYKGIAVMWNIPLFGSNRVAIAPGLDKDGKMKDEFFFDEQRVKVLTKKEVPEAKEMAPERKRTGCNAFKAPSHQPRRN